MPILNITNSNTSKISYTIKEFCTRHGISSATFYRLRERGDGPDIIKIGRCTRITAEAEQSWLHELQEAPMPDNA